MSRTNKHFSSHRVDLNICADSSEGGRVTRVELYSIVTHNVTERYDWVVSYDQMLVRITADTQLAMQSAVSLEVEIHSVISLQ